ncbi:MAG: hypothetical protein EXS05_05710 [Planctomycetaceae bacterium]|nr:hypothetical protein [Planctomycetaceae bacterium]
MSLFDSVLSGCVPHGWILAQTTAEPIWLSPGSVMAVATFSFLTLTIVIPAVAHYWHAAKVSHWEASLKQAMIERGMSADDIKAVLDAGSHGK